MGTCSAEKAGQGHASSTTARRAEAGSCVEWHPEGDSDTALLADADSNSTTTSGCASRFVSDRDPRQFATLTAWRRREVQMLAKFDVETHGDTVPFLRLLNGRTRESSAGKRIAGASRAQVASNETVLFREQIREQ